MRFVREPGTVEERFWRRVKKTDGCWLWIGNTWKGYGRFFVSKGHVVRAHRFSYELHHGTLGAENACHSCDNPLCVRPDRLFNGSHTRNRQDCVVKERQARGTRIGVHKLTPDQIREIRGTVQIRGKGCHGPNSLAELARRYGVSMFAIWAIVKRKTWKHIE